MWLRHERKKESIYFLSSFLQFSKSSLPWCKFTLVFSLPLNINELDCSFRWFWLNWNLTSRNSFTSGIFSGWGWLKRNEFDCSFHGFWLNWILTRQSLNLHPREAKSNKLLQSVSLLLLLQRRNSWGNFTSFWGVARRDTAPCVSKTFCYFKGCCTLQ